MEATWPQSPGPLTSRGASGKRQSRDTASAGFTWVEEFGPLRPDDAAARALMARVRVWARRHTVLDVEHLDIALLGAGGGSPVVSGADQTGDTLVTSGWPATTTVLREGDFIRPTSHTRAYEVTADVTSSGAGTASVPINPSIFTTAGSPDDASPIIVANTGVAFFKARIVGYEMPTHRPQRTGDYYVAMRVAFEEAV